ncbi:MAG TPA: gamma-glutamyl-gamma-aminobutyrate hydrolase family protein [Bacteroidota bacterium]|nr:gamma-glutamyl-gamma-aminobutyrate hydrolase family protein [Bacteroidota bacterium]
MRIGITDNHRPKQYFDNYLTWIHRIKPNVEFVKLGYTLENADEVAKIDGLILTGGGDVHPKFYERPEAIPLTTEVNELRDAFECDVIERALEEAIPILGICRGMQIMNVFLGGTLVPDLVTAGFLDHATNDGIENRHAITPVSGSLLEAIVGLEEQTVNSVHHQAVEHLGRGLIASAISPDGVIEAAEWVLKDRMPFLLLIQWHPERMKDVDNPTVKQVAAHFLHEVTISINDKALR